MTDMSAEEIAKIKKAREALRKSAEFIFPRRHIYVYTEFNYI